MSVKRWSIHAGASTLGYQENPDGIWVEHRDYTKLEARLVELKAENERFREAGYKLMDALSRIDYACGEPNEMKVSGYDVHCDEDAVVQRVEKAITSLRWWEGR